MGQAGCMFNYLIHFMAEDTETNGLKNTQTIHNRA